ncbi:hypothetical protein [Jannaschia marina]|uniref:hypothetical protein n=1 Tax=Jannaschia marina TaxID=2741674 RepID=UPI0015CD00B5|nr:hypothetical protein [Jannaschia marina]
MMQDDSFERYDEPDMAETLDLLGEVVANVSARVDDQTKALESLRKTSVETRQAAFAARAQTDPKRYGEIVGDTVDQYIGETLDRLEDHSHLFMGQLKALVEITNAAQKATDQIRTSLAKQDAERRRVRTVLPYVALAFVALLAVLPSFAGRFEIGCTIYWGSWNAFGNYCVLAPDSPPWFLPGWNGP